ncbi:Uncharacterized protein PCOAH_00005310 [Plasmodium coatneyi]|uniref:Uncharacterized protein n=1 Tax=Plasmodium coatneyi TaxID=208452 RepID=A0A1B1DTY8_9APIC|nr:Uncharacterized protein PCOAH_00005310 [Plasmodium coatneyi]ANQ06240.1 Uncharacterized protein PCOAH_00005310 [Plasmodium coatneyi]
MHKRKASAPILGDWPSDSKRRCERRIRGDIPPCRKAKSEEHQIVDDALLKYKGGTMQPLGGLRLTAMKELTSPMEIAPFEHNPVEGGNLYGGTSKGHPQNSTHRLSPPVETPTNAQHSLLEKVKHEASNSIYEKVKTGEESKEEVSGGEEKFEQMKNDVSDPLCGRMSHEADEQADVKHVGIAHLKITNRFITKENEDQMKSSSEIESVLKGGNNGVGLPLRTDECALTNPRVGSDPTFASTLCTDSASTILGSNQNYSQSSLQMRNGYANQPGGCRGTECPSSDLPHWDSSKSEKDDDDAEKTDSVVDEKVSRDGKMATPTNGGKSFEENKPELVRDPSGYPPLMSTLSDELLCCTSNGSDETNKRSGTHECLTIPKGNEGGSTQVDMNHDGDIPSDEDKTFCETLTSEEASSKRIYHFRRSKNNIHIYTPGGGAYLTIKDNGEETPESMTSEQSNETLHRGSGQMKVKEEVNPGEQQRDIHFVNTQSRSFIGSTGESNHTYNRTGVRKRKVTYELECAQMNSRARLADGPTDTTPHEVRKYTCAENLHPRRRSAPGRTRKRKLLTPMSKKKVKAEKKKKKKKKIPGRIYKVIVRGKECWRAEWFVQKGLQEINCHNGGVHAAMAKTEMNTETNTVINTKTETGSGSFQESHPPGNENSLVKKSRQFSVSVYGPENARLFALFELIKYNSVPDGLREEANLCICSIKKNLMVQGGSSNKSRSGHFLPLMLSDWDDAYSPALFRKIQGDMVRNWGQFTDGGSRDVRVCSGNKEEPPRTAPHFDGYSYPRKGNQSGGFDHVIRCSGDFTSLGENPPNRVPNQPNRGNNHPNLVSNHPNRLNNPTGHVGNSSSHNQNNLVHSINAYNLHSRHMAHTFAANKPSIVNLQKGFNSSHHAYPPHGEEILKLQNGFPFGQLDEYTNGANTNWALRVNHPGYHYNYARGDDKIRSMATCASHHSYPNGYVNSHEDVRSPPDNSTADLTTFGNYFHSDGNAVNCKMDKMDKSVPAAFGPKMSNGGGNVFDQFAGGAAHLRG